jgi:AcrR family transcriptional regulator
VASAARDEEQRLRLLEGLSAAIREKGLAQAQVGDIVRHARASRRTFYKHFADKDAAFIELMRRLAAEVLVELDRATDPEAHWTAQVDQAVDTYLRRLAFDRALTVIYVAPAGGERVVRAQRDVAEAYARFVRERFNRARDPGMPEAGIERCYLLVTGLHHTVIRAIERGDDILALGPELKALFKAGLTAPVGVPVEAADAAGR